MTQDLHLKSSCDSEEPRQCRMSDSPCTANRPWPAKSPTMSMLMGRNLAYHFTNSCSLATASFIFDFSWLEPSISGRKDRRAQRKAWDPVP